MGDGGVIVGGWEYVWAAYVASAAVFVLSALFAHLRYRAERARAAFEAHGSNESGRPRD